MRTFVTIILVLMFLCGLFGNVPKFFNKVKVLWRIYWILASASLLVVLWVELPKMLFYVLIAVGHAWLWVPTIYIGCVYVIPTILCIVCIILDTACSTIYAFLWLIVYGIFSLIFGRISDKMQDKYLFYKKVVSGSQLVSKEERKKAERWLLLKKYYDIMNPFDDVEYSEDKEEAVRIRLEYEKEERIIRWVIILCLGIMVYLIIKVS